MFLEVYKHYDCMKNKLSNSVGQVATNEVSRNRHINKN